jgi:heme/copper-type cytochrome/quinol oxidase subunit 1
MCFIFWIWLLHHDNIPAYQSLLVQGNVTKNGVTPSTTMTLHQLITSTATVFTIMAEFVYWFTLFSGLTLNVKWLKVQFTVIFIPNNMIFFPQILRRTNSDTTVIFGLSRLYALHNIISWISSTISFIRVLILILVIWERIRTNWHILLPTQKRNSNEWLQNLQPAEPNKNWSVLSFGI